MKNIRSFDITVASTEEETQDGFHVKYTLYEEELENRLSYSVKVTVTHTGETSTVKDITSDRTKAHSMFEIICHGGVTPCCIHEVVEDLIESIDEITLHEHKPAPVKTV